jgi:hypothetical protein
MTRGPSVSLGEVARSKVSQALTKSDLKKNFIIEDVTSILFSHRDVRKKHEPA